MSTVPEVLRRYDTGLTEADIAAELERDFARLPGRDAAPLTQTELDHLRTHGGKSAEQVLESWDSAAERAARARALAGDTNQLAASSLSLEAAARLLGVDRSRISHRVSAGALYAVTLGSRRRIPTWQFDQGRELPGLAAVVAAVPARAHPLDVAALMSTAQDELGGRTPIEHLTGGGDPDPVTQLLADLERW